MKHLKKIQSVSEITPKDYMVIYSTGEKVFCKGSEPSPQFEMVDLGLPSGLKWANKNIGAETETDSGLYFQWGDTVGYYEGQGAEEHSSWETAPFNNGSLTFNETYFNSVKNTVCPLNDNKFNELDLKYDAAHIHMGDGWRIPTNIDFNEIKNNTTNKFVTNYKDSGVNGLLFTSNINGNTLFMPASGYVKDNSITYNGSQGFYWDSYDMKQGNAYLLRFSSKTTMSFYDYHCYGMSIRGVHA